MSTYGDGVNRRVSSIGHRAAKLSHMAPRTRTFGLSHMASAIPDPFELAIWAGPDCGVRIALAIAVT